MCGDDDDQSGAATAAAAPKRVARIDRLSGRRTELKFDPGGGNVNEPGSVSPFVQGEIDREGSGLSLTGGVRRSSSPTSW